MKIYLPFVSYAKTVLQCCLKLLKYILVGTDDNRADPTTDGQHFERVERA